MKTKTRLICTWGLPASGKTTYSRKLEKSAGHKFRVVSYDDMPSYRKSTKGFANDINQRLRSGYEAIIADSLILTNNEFVSFIDEIDIKNIEDITIQFWTPSVDDCLWNDKYRRSVNSEITIKNAKFEEPVIEQIKELCPKLKNIVIKVYKNYVIRKPHWKMFADKHRIEHIDGIVKSDTWSLGGTVGNCWNDNIHTVSSDTQPITCKEFDSLLESACPHITFLQYKKLYNMCVNIESYTENDYYGGSVEYGYYYFDISTLFSELMELGLVTIEY